MIDTRLPLIFAAGVAVSLGILFAIVFTQGARCGPSSIWVPRTTTFEYDLSGQLRRISSNDDDLVRMIRNYVHVLWWKDIAKDPDAKSITFAYNHSRDSTRAAISTVNHETSSKK